MRRTTQQLIPFFLLSCVLLWAPHLFAAPPASFENQTLLIGLNVPIAIEVLPDDRMLIVLKGGEILIADPTVQPVQTASYMTITNINSIGERGLLDITLDPNFASNGFFYIYYTDSSPGKNRISRFVHHENSGGLTSTGDLGSEFSVWSDPNNLQSVIHLGAGLDFGPDGRLYATPGDQSFPNLAQDLTSAQGKIIRVNSDGTIPFDNPFVDGPGGFEDGIWAYGLRNPFRARWDLPTGRFFIGEVGGNVDSLSQEDIHLATMSSAATNYGWPFCEGACDNPDFSSTCDCQLHDDPIFTYPHAGSGASVIGGFVYRGSQFPSAPYVGAYFYADFVRGWIRYLTFDASDTLVTGDFAFEPSAGSVIDLDEGKDGSLFYTTIEGELHRIRFDQGNQAPSITLIDASPTKGIVPLTVTFQGLATDAEGDSMTYEWLFGDGSSDSGSVVNDTIPPSMHLYGVEGVYQAFLTVSDSTHTTFSSPIIIEVGIPPEVTIDEPIDLSLFRAGDLINFSATATDSNGIIDPGDHVWDILFRHNQHFHPVILGQTGTSGSFSIPTSGHDFSSNTGYVLAIEVTDSDGLTARDTVEILPDKVNIAFDTDPSGLTVFLDGIPRVTPFVYDTLIDFKHELGAPLSQCFVSTAHNFVAWSDSGSATHTILVPDIDTFHVATYSQAGNCAEPTNAGLVLRLQGDGPLTTTNDTTVIFWIDKSLTGNNLVHVAGTPVIVPNALNGHQVVRFDTFDDALGRFGFNSLPVGNMDRSIFMVVRYGEDGSGSFKYGKDDCNEIFGLSVSENDPNLAVQGKCAPNDFTSTEAGAGAGWISHAVVYQSNEIVHFKDGSEIQNDNHVFNTGSDALLLAPEGDDDPEFDFEVAEILVYDRALGTSERLDIELYFRNTYLGPLSPQISIVAPAEADTVAGDTVTVSWESNGELTQADHVHVSVDGGSPVMLAAFDSLAAFPGIIPGVHLAEVELSAADHSVLARDSVNFVVVPGSENCQLLTTNLVLHLESDFGIGKSGTLVTNWLDQSGFGNDFTANGDPQYVTGSGPNGKPYIEFDGDQDRLIRNALLDNFPAGSDERSLFFVVRYNSGDIGGFAYGLPLPNQSFGLGTDGANLMVRGLGGANDYVSSEPGVGEGWLVHSAVTRPNRLDHYRDGVLVDTRVHSYATDLNSAVIGEDITGLESVVIDVAAVLIYDGALTDGERLRVEGYLQEKFLGIICNPNPPPVAVDDAGSMPQGGTFIIDVLANDYEPGGAIDSTSVAIGLSPANAAVLAVHATTGEIVYQHDGTPTTADSLSYTVEDDDGQLSNQAMVRLTLTSGGNQPPAAVDDTAFVSIGGVIVIPVLTNDSDPDGILDSTTVRVFHTASSGLISIDEFTGEITYVHNGFDSAPDSLTYLVRDNAGDWSNLATVRIIPNVLVAVEAANIPRQFALYQNVPNPTNGRTSIRFDLPIATPTNLHVYDVRGRTVRSAISGTAMAAGQHTWIWDGRDDSGTIVASGIYFYRLDTPHYTASRKIHLQN